MEGDREITLMFGDVQVVFGPESTISFYSVETEERLFHMAPTDLSVIYGAYMQMLKELKEVQDGSSK